MPRRLSVLLACLLPVAASATPAAHVVVETEDSAPRFLAWLDAAKAAPDADARWVLWQSLYGEAAVPPTPQGRAIARRLVDAAWPRYDAAVPAARAGLSPWLPAADAMLQRVAATLGLEGDARIRLKGIVGAFEHNAYSYRADVPVVVVPLESLADMPLAIAHEGTHALQMAIQPDASGFERSLAYAALQEGLAMHVACRLVEHATPSQCTGGGPHFLDDATRDRDAILRGARTDLSRRDAATLMRYTFGDGNTGVHRELYAVGWFVVARLRADGMDFATLARLSEAQALPVVERAIDEQLRH